MLDPERGLRRVATRAALAPPRRAPAGRRPTRAHGSSNALELIPRCARRPSIDAAAITGVGVAGCVPCVLAARRGRLAAASGVALQRRSRRRRDRRDRRRARRRAACSSAPARAITQQSVGPKLLWLQRHEPEVWERTRRIAGSYDWVAGRLADAEFAERNWALESGLYELENAHYAPDLCAAAGIDKSLLGPIRDPRQVIGGITDVVAARTGLQIDIPVVAGMADHVSSAFAAGLAEHGDVLVKLGGSVDVLACSDRPLLDARLYLDAHPSSGLWLPNGCMASGGSAMRWFQRELAGRCSRSTCWTREAAAIRCRGRAAS